MATIPSTAMVRDAIDESGRFLGITLEEFDAWLQTHDATLRSTVLMTASEEIKTAGFPIHPDRWLKQQAGEAHRTFGKDWL